MFISFSRSGADLAVCCGGGAVGWKSRMEGWSREWWDGVGSGEMEWWDGVVE